MMTLKVEGYVEAKKILDQLPNQMQKSIIASALRKAAQPMLKDARTKVPKKTGRLSKQLKTVRLRKGVKRGEVAIAIKHVFQRNTAGEVTNEYYGLFLHEGTKERKPKKKGGVLVFKNSNGDTVFAKSAAPIKKNPYLEKAYTATKTQTTNIFGKELASAVERFVKKKFKHSLFPI